MINTANTVKIDRLKEIMVTSKTDNKEQIDADILQCKADILRAGDTIPSFKEKAPQEPKSQEMDENTSYLADTTEKSAEIPQKQAEIPKFDLADEIMAEQRKITAIKRKGPDKKDEAQRQDGQVKPVSCAVKQPTPEPSQQEQIIAEIVARDIERLCRGGALGQEQNSRKISKDTK